MLKSYNRVCNVLTINISSLSEITGDIKLLYNFTHNDKRKVMIDNKEINLKDINKDIIQKIFNYDWFRNGQYCKKWKKASKKSTTLLEAMKLCGLPEDDPLKYWSAAKLCELLNLQIKTCAYCNLQYIEYVNISNEKYKLKLNWAFDHYYSKDDYPFLGISIYNLIPVCEICNSRFKRTEQLSINKYLQPYYDDFHKIAHFQVKSKRRINDLKNLKPEDFEIELEENKNRIVDDKIKEKKKDMLPDIDRANNTCSFFHIIERILYIHYDYIGEIILKHKEYIEEYQKHLISKYKIHKEEIERLIYGNYINPEDINKRPLSKLVIDIINYFKIIDNIVY